MSELRHRAYLVRAALGFQLVELLELLGQFLVLLPPLAVFRRVVGVLLVLAHIAEVTDIVVLAADVREAVVYPAVQGGPLVLRLENRLAAVGEITLLVELERRGPERL